MQTRFRASRRASWIIAVVLCGCETATEPTDDGVSALQFQDIPVPSELRLVERFHSSDSRELGEYRYANFVYAGALPVGGVCSYLLERMPQHSWELEQDTSGSDGYRSLRFRRGNYAVDCVLTPQSNSRTRMEMTVRTNVGQAAQGASVETKGG